MGRSQYHCHGIRPIDGFAPDLLIWYSSKHDHFEKSETRSILGPEKASGTKMVGWVSPVFLQCSWFEEDTWWASGYLSKECRAWVSGREMIIMDHFSAYQRLSKWSAIELVKRRIR